MSSPLVAVTGASGYIAGSVIKALLAKGYRVRGTVRCLANEERVKHLKEAFPGIELFEADLLKDGSFAACFDGVDYVLHTASPFQLQVEDPQRDLIDPAVKGTENVVLEALRVPSLKRIVVTSSVAAVVGHTPKGSPYTEEDWNLESTLENAPYRLSKRLAEEKAWELVKTQQRPEGAAPVTMATVNPSLVLGPPHSNRTDSTSVKIVRGLLAGAQKDGAMSLCLACVDVRDVADAHVAAMELEAAAGKRFIASSEAYYTVLELCDMLRTTTHEGVKARLQNLPTTFASAPGEKHEISVAAAREVLGIEFRSLETSLHDMAAFMVDQGMV